MQYHIRTLLALCCFALLFTVGCKEEEPMPIGTPFEHLAGMKGNFRLKEVLQVDNTASGNNLKSLDISEFMIGTNPMIMTVGDSSVTFTMNDSRDLFTKGIATQKWSFDNANYPSFFQLENGVNLKLGHPVRAPFDKEDLDLVLVKSYDPTGKPSITYSFKFARN